MTTKAMTAAQIKALTVEEVAGLDESVRSKARMTEDAAAKKAAKDGVTDYPTPVADWFKSQEPGANKSKAKAKAAPVDPALKGTDAPKGMVNFYVDGRRVAETQHTLSYMAGYTRTKQGNDRLGVKQLVPQILEATGFATEGELMRNEWTFVLPQTGRVISTKLIPGRKEEAPAAPVAAEQPAEETAQATPKRTRSRKPAAA